MQAMEGDQVSRVIKLAGERYDAAGRKTGDTEVTLWRAGMGGDVILTIGNRQAWVNPSDLRAAVEHLVSTADMVGIAYSGGERYQSDETPCERAGVHLAGTGHSQTDCPTLA